MGISWASSPTFLALLLVTLLGFSEVSRVRADAVAQFIFGDSLVDQGNNNNLNSIAKANFAPNGIDYAMSNYQPTGRFSNGRIVSDFMSEHMGVPPVLPYNDQGATGQNLLRGCNFASAGSGILDDTGAIFITHLTIPTQLQYFQNVQQELTSMLGAAGASDLVSKAIFSFTIGGNDFINNYLLPGSQRARDFTVDQFTSLLIDTFKQQLTDVYNLGARKISVSNIGPIGCIPSQLSTKSENGACIDSLNQLSLGYNSLLKPMLTSLNQQLPGVTIVYTDAYLMVMDYVMNPAQHGFVSSNTACCGTGRFNGLLPCTALGTLCPDRTKYLFWDPFHPSDKANELVTQRLLYGPPSEVYPINISQLLAL